MLIYIGIQAPACLGKGLQFFNVGCTCTLSGVKVVFTILETNGNTAATKLVGLNSRLSGRIQVRDHLASMKLPNVGLLLLTPILEKALGFP
jgi:hypothetical protein